MEICMCFCVHLKHSLLGIYQSEKCFCTKVVEKNGMRIQCPVHCSVSCTVFEVIKCEGTNIPELLCKVMTRLSWDQEQAKKSRKHTIFYHQGTVIHAEQNVPSVQHRSQTLWHLMAFQMNRPPPIHSDTYDQKWPLTVFRQLLKMSTFWDSHCKTGFN